MGSYESVCNDTDTPVVVWWQLLGGGPVLDAAVTACLVVGSAIMAFLVVLAALATGKSSGGSGSSSSGSSFWWFGSPCYYNNGVSGDRKPYMGSGHSNTMLYPKQCTPWKKLTLSLVHQVCAQEQPSGTTMPRPICQKMWSPSLANHYSSLKVSDITGQRNMHTHLADARLKLYDLEVHRNNISYVVIADVCVYAFFMAALMGFYKLLTGQKLLQAFWQEPLLHL